MIQKFLTRKQAIDADLRRMTKQWHSEWKKQYTPATLTVLDSLIDFLNRGGKRVRGALAMESYYLHGGTNEKVALGAARVVELIQAYLLIMDDIQDQSAQRRGGAAVHVQLAGKHGDHYGVAQGLNAEMLAYHRAMTELMELSAHDSAKVRTAQLLNQDISITIIGQINDLYNQVATRRVDEQAVIKTLTWKTAYYTFISPLELGACLAGTDGLSDRLCRYAINVGIAFQISDDILGIFGDSREVGKSANDDIREGKATLLAVYAREHATPPQLQILEKTLGDRNATKEECDHVREIFETTGARSHAAHQADEYAARAEVALGENPEDFLLQLARFVVGRKS